MNKKRRDKIGIAIGLLDRVSDIVSECVDEESDSMSNLEGTALEYTSKYESIESSCEYLDSALEKIDSAKDELCSAMYP